MTKTKGLDTLSYLKTSISVLYALAAVAAGVSALTLARPYFRKCIICVLAVQRAVEGDKIS
jgi:hypothetical protein